MAGTKTILTILAALTLLTLLISAQQQTFTLTPADTNTSTQNDAVTLKAKYYKLGPQLLQQIDTLGEDDERLKIQVNLQDDPLLQAELNEVELSSKKLSKQEKLDKIFEAKRKSYGKTQDKVLAKLNSSTYKLRFKMSHSNIVTLEADKKTIEQLELMPEVESIEEIAMAYITLAQSAPQINAPEVWAQQVNGDYVTGVAQTVCVLDTGVNYSHLDLGGAAFPNSKVIAGHDFVNDDDDPMDDHGHGTNVAGIVASTDPTYTGIAPGANIAALKVLNAAGGGNFDYVNSAIEWCIDNRVDLNISVITMSIGVPTYHTCSTSTCAGFIGDGGTTQSISDAWDAGIFVVAASGNEANTAGITYPACLEKCVSVGAVYDQNLGGIAWTSCTDTSTAIDKVTCFTNRCEILDLFAPGAVIYASEIWMGGTSQATPHVAGAAALLNHYSQLRDSTNLAPADIKQALIDTGVLVTRDVTKPRIDIEAAAQELFPTTTTSSSTTSSSSTSSSTTSSTVPTTTSSSSSSTTTTLANSPPTLTSPNVTPIINETGNIFNFTVVYTDAENEAPSFIRVVLDGANYYMEKIAGAYNTGATYQNITIISGVGTHRHYFTASDGTTTVATGVYLKPFVTNTSNCVIEHGHPLPGDWTVDGLETCYPGAFLASHVGDLTISDGRELTLQGATVYLNGTRLIFNGESRLILNDGGVHYI